MDLAHDSGARVKPLRRQFQIHRTAPTLSAARLSKPHWNTWVFPGGQSLAGTSVDWVFIGSCATPAFPTCAKRRRSCEASTLRPVQAWVVPGSQRVKEIAEAEGLADVFRSAGLEWREPGCSMCRRQRRRSAARPAHCQHVKSQLYRPSGTGRPHAPQARNGCGCRDCRRHRRSKKGLSHGTLPDCRWPAAPLLRRDVDTDIIIRIERLTGLPKDQLGHTLLKSGAGPTSFLTGSPSSEHPS